MTPCQSNVPTRLLVSVGLQLSNGMQIPIKMLVDTGSQVNLIKKGIVHDSLFRVSKNPVKFIAANQQVVSGGQRELEGQFFFDFVNPDTCEKQF